jgi:hypothetical protein
LSLRGTQFNRKSRWLLGGSIVLVESRRVRERRLRPQAGCHVQPFNATPVNAPRLFGCATEADLAWVGQLQAPKVRLSCTDQKYVCNRAMRKKNDRDGAALQRFATDTTCNDTRQADGEPRELVNSVDKGFGPGDLVAAIAV